MTVTLTELAKQLELSPSTVSCVLNGKTERFAESTVRRVREAARRCGYRPNASARATRSGRFCSLALVVGADRRRSYLPPALLGGIAAAAEAADLSLQVTMLVGKDRDEALPKALREGLCDGLLINVHKPDTAALDRVIKEIGLPHRWINLPQRDAFLAPDDEAAARRAVAELVERGHRRIAYINTYYSGKTPHHPSVELREIGYRKAVAEAGLGALVVTNDVVDRFQRWPALFEPLLEGPQRPTAVVCYAPVMAGQLILTACRQGLQVPRDLSVLAFADDDPFHLGVAVDALQVPWRGIGQRAVRSLCAALAKAEPPEEEPLQWRRRDYGTVAEPPQS